MAFLRVLTHRSGRQYLYEEWRWREDGRVCSKGHSLGRIGAGFWFWLGVLIDNLGEPRAFSLDEYHAEQQAQERDLREREEAEQKLYEVTHPWVSEVNPLPAAPEIATPAAEPGAPAAAEASSVEGTEDSADAAQQSDGASPADF